MILIKISKVRNKIFTHEFQTINISSKLIFICITGQVNRIIKVYKYIHTVAYILNSLYAVFFCSEGFTFFILTKWKLGKLLLIRYNYWTTLENVENSTL